MAVAHEAAECTGRGPRAARERLAIAGSQVRLLYRPYRLDRCHQPLDKNRIGPHHERLQYVAPLCAGGWILVEHPLYDRCPLVELRAGRGRIDVLAPVDIMAGDRATTLQNLDRIVDERER